MQKLFYLNKISLLTIFKPLDMHYSTVWMSIMSSDEWRISSLTFWFLFYSVFFLPDHFFFIFRIAVLQLYYAMFVILYCVTIDD